MFRNSVTTQRVLRRAKTLNNIYKATTASFCSRRVTKCPPQHIGIDLGTTNTYISVIEQGNDNRPKLFKKLSSGMYIKPKPMDDAKFDQDCNTGWKRLLGRKFNDPIVQNEIRTVRYKIVECPDTGDALIETSKGVISPYAFLGIELKIINEELESYLGSPVSRAVFAYPSCIEGVEEQIKHISIAAGYAGIRFQLYISEPIAAALAYVSGGLVKKEGRVFAVVDLGGRTFKVSLLQVSSSGRFNYIRPTKSDTYLGGEDFDSAVFDYLLKELNLDEKDRIRIVANFYQNFRQVIEVAKKQLSTDDETMIKMPVGEARWALDTSLTRSEFESVTEHLTDKIGELCQNSLKDAGLMGKDVDEVLLVGGMANVPILQKVVTQIFGKSPRAGVNPEEAVVLGAAAAVHAGHFGEDAWDFQ